MRPSPSSVTLGGHGGFRAGDLQCARRSGPARIDRAAHSAQHEADRAPVGRPLRGRSEPGMPAGDAAVLEVGPPAIVRRGGDDRARGERGLVDRAAAVWLLRRSDGAALDAACLGAPDGRRLRADGPGGGLLGVAMGLGVAAYHPEAYKTATSVAGEKKATALSWFSLGGNVGIALGPPVITALVTVVGVMGSLGLLLPTLVATMLLLAVLPAFSPTPAPRAAAAAAARGVNMPRAMALLILVVTIRSWTTLGFTTFVPFYYIDTLGADPRLVGPLLFVFLGAGAAGTVIAGPLADRWGSRAFMQWVLLAALPFGVLFLLVRGALAFVMLGIFGALLTSSFTVSVVLGQAYLPRNAGTASGLIVGFAIGAGGLGVTALGWVADRYGLPSALWISALMPLLAFATTRLLPAPRVHEAR